MIGLFWTKYYNKVVIPMNKHTLISSNQINIILSNERYRQFIMRKA